VIGNLSFDEVARNFNEEATASKARTTEKLKEALARLSKDSVRKVMVEYDGHEDDGFVKKVTLVTTNGRQFEIGEKELVSEMYQQKAPESGPDAPAPPSSLGPIVDFVIALLEEKAGGWETSEGGFGTCVIDVETGEYDLNHIWGYGSRVKGGE